MAECTSTFAGNGTRAFGIAGEGHTIIRATQESTVTGEDDPLQGLMAFERGGFASSVPDWKLIASGLRS